MNAPFVIPSDLAEAINGPVMIVLSVSNARFHATIGRSLGAVCRSDGRIDVFVSAAQWPDTVENAVAGKAIAVTFGNPSSYRCWQVKGVIEDAAPADPTEAARGHLYAERMTTLLTGWDVSRQQLSHTFCTAGLWRVRLRATEIFNQTPGQGAGERLGAA